MSIQAVSFVLERTKSRLGDRLVLISLANHYNDSIGISFPSVSTMARESGLSIRQVHRALVRLCQFGAISQKTGYSEWGTRMYEISHENFVTPDKLSDDKSDTKRPLGGDKSDKIDTQNVTQSILRNPEDKKYTHEQAREVRENGIVKKFEKAKYSPEFERLRSIYPKRDGDHRWHNAYQAYLARLKDGATHMEIEDGVLRYAKYCKRKGIDGTQFVKQAATFLGTNRCYLEAWTAPRSAFA